MVMIKDVINRSNIETVFSMRSRGEIDFNLINLNLACDLIEAYGMSVEEVSCMTEAEINKAIDNFENGYYQDEDYQDNEHQHDDFLPNEIKNINCWRTIDKFGKMWNFKTNEYYYKEANELSSSILQCGEQIFTRYNFDDDKEDYYKYNNNIYMFIYNSIHKTTEVLIEES